MIRRTVIILVAAAAFLIVTAVIVAGAFPGLAVVVAVLIAHKLQAGGLSGAPGVEAKPNKSVMPITAMAMIVFLSSPPFASREPS